MILENEAESNKNKADILLVRNWVVKLNPPFSVIYFNGVVFISMMCM